MVQSSQEGDAPMTQEIIVWVLLLELVGLILVMVLAILDDDHHSFYSRQENASPEPRGGYEPQEHSPQRSTVAA